MTTIGILSDSHGRTKTTRRAVQALLERGATMLVHLGDVGDSRVLEELCVAETHVVWGNCDWPIAALERTARHLGIHVHHPAGELVLDGKRIAFTHGHLTETMRRLLDAGADYLLFGHTHVAADERRGRTRLINPGALFRAARYTAAVLDPARDHVDFIEISRDG